LLLVVHSACHIYVCVYVCIYTYTHTHTYIHQQPHNNYSDIQTCGKPPTCFGLFRSPSGRYLSVKISTFWACANWNYPCCVHISATVPQLNGWKEPKHERGLLHAACHIYSAVGAEMATSLTA
jgi:hypothetical protein